MSDFGLIGQAYEAASLTQDCQRTINWYPEIDITKQLQATEKRGVIALYPTPGLVKKAQLISAEVRGLYVLPGDQLLLAVCGSNLYKIDTSYNATHIGTLNSYSGKVSITDNGVGAYLTDGQYRYSYIWATNTFQVKNDGAFTGGYLCDETDNFIVYTSVNSNQFGCTNVGDVASSALNFASMLSSSNYLIGLIVDHRQIILLGERTGERWIDVGTFPFPFSIVPGSSIQHGLAARNSLCKFGAGVAYLAQDQRGNATVMMWGATFSEPQKISTYAIENAIQSYEVTSDAIAYAYSQAGHEFYVLTFPTQDVTWVYDITTEMWHQRAWRDPLTGILHRHRSNCGVLFNGNIVLGDFENGKIYEFSQSTYTDDGDPILCLRRGPHITNELKRIFFSDMQLQFQPGVGLSTGQGSDPQCMLRWSNDGGFTWSDYHFISIGAIGNYKNRAIKRKLGWGRDRVFEVSVTDPVYRVLVSANLNASAGAN